ncbi:hypothetical protein [Eleftheria terrae]|uniref:hypothetical protein n=1 Tax=Eleftheria terrae TaxID=1597781 RepID=UPI00263B36A0|nr:hypothetical protein [Eleftheria terrae]WKB51526.1 hypothetical protein N7L95_17185 [Eleftheria terrae]
MSSFNFSGAGPHSLTRIGEAWRNPRALLTLLGTFVGVALLIGLGVSTGVGFISAVSVLLGFLLMMLGMVAAGRQLMDQALQQPVTGTVEAFTGSPMVLLRMLGLALVLLCAFLAWGVTASVLLFLCKIPLLGGLLLVVVVPLLVFSAALLLLGAYVAWGLAAPALFEGQTLKQALSRLWAIATQRPLEAFLNLMLLFILVGFVAGLVMAFVGGGFAVTASVMNSVLGMGLGGLEPPNGTVSSSTWVGAGVGAAVVWGVVIAVFNALLLFGLCLTYLKLSVGLDTALAEAALDSAIAKTREKAQQAAEEARRRAQEVQDAARRRGESAAAARAPEADDLPGATPPAPASSYSDPMTIIQPMTPAEPPRPAPVPPAPGHADPMTIIQPMAPAEPPRSAPVPPATGHADPMTIIQPMAPAEPPRPAPVPPATGHADPMTIIQPMAPAQPPRPAPVPPPSGHADPMTIIQPMAPAQPPRPAAAPHTGGDFEDTLPPAVSPLPASGGLDLSKPVPHCPSCHSVVAPDDTFCGACGRKLH